MTRSTLLIFAALLLMGASLGSATPATPPAPSTDLQVLELSVTNMTAATPSCAKARATVDRPHPQWMTTSGEYCGACSLVPCALGAARFTRCGYGLKGWCDYTSNYCEEDWLPSCECVGPIDP